MITIVEGLKPNVFGIQIDGKLDEAHMEALTRVLDQISFKYKQDTKFYAEIENFEGYSSIEAFWKDVKATTKHFTSFSKVAIVTDNELWKKLAKGADFLSKGDINVYSKDEKQKALTWVNTDD